MLGAADRALTRLERLKVDGERLVERVAEGEGLEDVSKELRAVHRGLEGVASLIREEVTVEGAAARVPALLDALGSRLEDMVVRGDDDRLAGWLDRFSEVGALFADATPLVDPTWLQDNRGLVEERLARLVDVREPLLLVSQVQRSGGTLLSQLFDAHPQLHAHPHELYIGHLHKTEWPDLHTGGDPPYWYRRLREMPAVRAYEEGYRKTAGVEDDGEVFPFDLPPPLQAALFERCIAARGGIESQREILDCYMTSYFNAWLDNRNLSGDKRWVTAFVPRLHMTEGSLDGFFRAYADGLLVSIVRDPRGWWASASAQRDSLRTKRVLREYATVESGIDVWKRSTVATSDAARRYEGKVYVMRFEDLVGDTEEAMRKLAARAGIEFDDVLLTPSFNGRPIKAASSFDVNRHGVLEDPLTRYREELSATDLAYIEAEAMPLYEKVAALAA
jgi:Sulfotransferase family